MKALITGITGQDGSYLAEILLDKGYEVHGLIRRNSQYTHSNIEQIKGDIRLHYGDMTDPISIQSIVRKVQPDEIYNLAGMSQVRISYDVPHNVFDVNTQGLLYVLEAVRGLDLDCKIYQSSSSEMFGRVREIPQTESTPFYPLSPYGVSKAAAHQLAVQYRESYGMKVYNGILFNHESPRRGEDFLSRKVAKGVAAIAAGRSSTIVLGNLDAKRDWGYAKEYCNWMRCIISHPIADDFVLATGETHTVREFVEEAFRVAGINDWQDRIKTDASLFRPAEVDLLIGSPDKSERLLGFKPQVKFKELVKIMVEHEMNII